MDGSRISKFHGVSRCVAVVAAVCWMASSAVAAPLATTLLAFNDGNGQHASGRWQNSKALTMTTPSVLGAINGAVEYAVFAPGVFQTFANTELGGGPYVIPEAAANYIYAFQFQPTVGTVESLNAGYDTGTHLGIPTVKPQWLAGSGSKSPNSAATFLNLNSAVWGYGTGLGTSSLVSDIVFYAHPHGPIPDQVTLRGFAGTGQADSGSMDFASPNPIPEPAGLLLAFLGAASLALWRKR